MTPKQKTDIIMKLKKYFVDGELMIDADNLQVLWFDSNDEKWCVNKFQYRLAPKSGKVTSVEIEDTPVYQFEVY